MDGEQGNGAMIRVEGSASRRPYEMDVIRQGMRAHAAQHVPAESYAELTLYARDPCGQLVGAFLGETGRGWLHVSVLWIAEGFRRQGLGTRLLIAGEGEARKRGCKHAYLDSFDYQSPSFYQRRGYETFGTLDEYPAGHRRYFLRKTLSQVSQS